MGEPKQSWTPFTVCKAGGSQDTLRFFLPKLWGLNFVTREYPWPVSETSSLIPRPEL